MRRSLTGPLTLLLASMLLAGCGNTLPSGPPPALTFPTSTGTGSSSGSTAGGKTLQILRLSGQVQAVAWSPDGTQIATVNQSTPAMFQVWNVATGQQVSTYSGSFSDACCLAWSPDGKRILSGGVSYAGGDPNKLRIWDAASGALIAEFVSDSTTEFSALKAAAWSPDGARIAVLILTGAIPSASNPNPSAQETLQILDAATGQALQTDLLSQTTQFEDQVFAVLAWSPDSKEVAVAGHDKTVHIWDITSGKQLLVYRGHKNAVLALAWSPTGRAIASADGEPEVQVWEPTTGNVFLRYQGHAGNVVALAWSPDGNRLVSGSQSAGGILEDHPIQVWDAFTGRHPFYYTRQSDSVTALTWSPDGKEIASAGGETVQVWQAPAES